MKRMVRALVILTIITVLLLAILNSCARLRPHEYQPIVSYESKTSTVAEIKTAGNDNSNDLGVLGNILHYERIILISSIILVIIFTFLFFNFSPKKK